MKLSDSYKVLKLETLKKQTNKQEQNYLHIPGIQSSVQISAME